MSSRFQGRWDESGLGSVRFLGVLSAPGAVAPRMMAESLPADHPWLALLDRSPLGVLVHDATDRVLHANASFAQLVDLPVAQLLDTPVGALIQGPDAGALAEIKARVLAGELDAVTVDRRLVDGRGRPLWVRMFTSALWIGGQRLVMVCVTDLWEWQQRVDQLGYAATHDELTGLLNRSGLAGAVARLPPSRGAARLAVLDLNGLKLVNDAHGHAAGDDVLRVTAELLLAASAPTWLIGRLGGDEFVVVDTEPDPTGPDLLDILEAALRTTVTIAPGVLFPLSASVGEVAFSPDENFDEALRHADREMYRHKRSGARSSVRDVPRQTRHSQRAPVTDEVAVRP